MIKRIILFLAALLPFALGAQQADGPQMADTFRQEGKIYIVITVIGIIFIALVLFLIYIERRLKGLEEKVKDPSTSLRGTESGK